MILSQNAFVLTTNELDAIETGKYNDNNTTVLCGSSMCRSKVSVSKIIEGGDYTKEKRQNNDRKSEYLTDVKDRILADTTTVPTFDQFQRDTPVKPVGIGAGNRSMSKRTKTKIRQKMMAWSRTPRQLKGGVKFQFLTLGLVGDQVDENGLTHVGRLVNAKGEFIRPSIIDQNGHECPVPCYNYVLPSYVIDQNGDYAPCPTDCCINHQAEAWQTRQFNAMLNKFFTWCRKYLPFKNYLYVLEIQTKSTGRLHAHIIVDIPYLPIVRMNAEWVKIQYESGIRFKGERRHAGKGGVNPLDRQEIFNVDRVATYVTKYVTKNESEIDGTRWNCSNTISRLFTSVKIFTSEAFASIYNDVLRVVQAKLDNGETLHIHLLSQYTRLQAQHFRINNEVITGSLDREQYIKSLQA